VYLTQGSFSAHGDGIADDTAAIQQAKVRRSIREATFT
jgi:hypothetical protein